MNDQPDVVIPPGPAREFYFTGVESADLQGNIFLHFQEKDNDGSFVRGGVSLKISCQEIGLDMQKMYESIISLPNLQSRLEVLIQTQK